MDTRKYIFLVYLLTSFVSINATTYFISSSLGNDSNSGLSLQNPIKTISRLNAFNFYPGDSILFKSQDTFHGMFWIKGSGDLTHPIVVDTYGGMGRHGGGAFSDKDPTKVDRSAAYYSRWVAKHIVAAGLATRCEIQVAYVIGVSQPVSLHVNSFGTGIITDKELENKIKSFL